MDVHAADRSYCGGNGDGCGGSSQQRSQPDQPQQKKEKPMQSGIVGIKRILIHSWMIAQ